VVRVVDTSVVVKWFVDEGDSALASQYIGTALVAPELMLAEIGNAIWKKWRKSEVTTEQAHMVTAFTASFVEILSGELLAEEAVRIAIELSHPVYDCYFLAMAHELDTQVLTFDRKLVRACADTKFAERLHFLGSAA
jgi:predicted nucleic acid-binding protein